MKVTSPELRGKMAEERLIKIARSLKRDRSWIRRVKRASQRLDRAGIDILVFIRRPDGGRDIKVPIQVKSSRTGILKWREQHPECVEAGVIAMVVNENFSDATLCIMLLTHLFQLRLRGKDFDNFFASLDTSRTRTIVRTGRSFHWQRLNNRIEQYLYGKSNENWRIKYGSVVC